MLNDTWVFPSDRDASKPLPRHTANKWWRRAERLAEITHVAGTGYHSARRKFASEMKSTNLRDLAYMGGWKNPQTVLTVYRGGIRTHGTLLTYTHFPGVVWG
jgi:integrase